jgi:hypothetical protein
MKLKMSRQNPRLFLDEYGNEILEFKGLHWEDMRIILARVNDFEEAIKEVRKYGSYSGYSKRDQEI